MQTPSELRRTALYQEHLALKGRMVNFGGWELPVQYAGVIEEHRACRTHAGLFDVSHMGELSVKGPDAAAFLNWALTNNVATVQVGQAQYSALCQSDGGTVDDLVLYRRGPEEFLVVVNASNTEKDFKHFQEVLRDSQFENVKISNESASWSQIAVQGPRALEIVQQLTSVTLADLKTYWCREGLSLGKIPTLFGRTGYTGEDGFELYCPWDHGPELWRALLACGGPLGLKPCGLAARDTLRLEMKYPLYGNELSEKTHPLEAGLGWVVKLTKPDFVGKRALIAAKEAGIKRKLIGFKMKGRGIPRHGYPLLSSPDLRSRVGEVTSGSQSPSLNEAIGIGYVLSEYANTGSTLFVEIRGEAVEAQVCETPFYKKEKSSNPSV